MPRPVLPVLALVLAAGAATGQDEGRPCADPNVVPMVERISKSEQTRNFLALTVYRPELGAPFRRIMEIESFPGWTDAGEPVLDRDGGWLYAFETDEAGVGASYFWLLRRAQFTDPRLRPTPRQLAHSMAGVNPAHCDAETRPTEEGVAQWSEAAERWCGRVRQYLDEWLALAGLYFIEPPEADEVLDLEDPDELWNWMRVMYHHESGRTPVVDRATFERGVRLATDYIAAGDQLERPMADYLYPCGGEVVTASVEPSGDAGVEAELRAVIAELDRLGADLAAMQARVETLRARVEALTR